MLIEEAKEINIYYVRSRYTLTLSKGDYITQVTGSGEYKVGQSVAINATVGSYSGYTTKWSQWTSSNTNLISNKSVQNVTITMPAGNVTLTASATRSLSKYTVTCIDKVNSTSGTELGRTTWSADYGTTAYGSSAGSNTTLGKYYAGYYYSNCTSATVTTTGCTVYRIFTPAEYTITYNANGGSGTMTTGTKYTGQTYTIENSSFTAPSEYSVPNEYVFVGWATSKANASSGVVDYKAKSKYSSNSDLTLYAVWKCSSQKVSQTCKDTETITVTCGGTSFVESTEYSQASLGCGHFPEMTIQTCQKCRRELTIRVKCACGTKGGLGPTVCNNEIGTLCKTHNLTIGHSYTTCLHSKTEEHYY